MLVSSVVEVVSVLEVVVEVSFSDSSTLGTENMTEPTSSDILRRIASETCARSIRSRPNVSYRQCSEMAP